ncbi:hypothetical protein MTO96_042588 [Rhipicephalus appendiculatus]
MTDGVPTSDDVLGCPPHGRPEQFCAHVIWFQHCQMQTMLCCRLLFYMTCISHKRNSAFCSCCSGFRAGKCGLSTLLSNGTTYACWCDCVSCESHQTGGIND